MIGFHKTQLLSSSEEAEGQSYSFTNLTNPEVALRFLTLCCQNSLAHSSQSFSTIRILSRQEQPVGWNFSVGKVTGLCSSEAPAILPLNQKFSAQFPSVAIPSSSSSPGRPQPGPRREMCFGKWNLSGNRWGTFLRPLLLVDLCQKCLWQNSLLRVVFSGPSPYYFCSYRTCSYQQ
jgi:hypothetical protein